MEVVLGEGWLVAGVSRWVFNERGLRALILKKLAQWVERRAARLEGMGSTLGLANSFSFGVSW